MQQRANSVGVGIVGLGLMGTRMAGALAQHDRFQVRAGFDADAGLSRSWCDEQGARVAASARALIEDERVDLVYIATPPASHVALALHALACHKPVLVEKPLAVDLAEAQELTRAVQASRGRLWMHFPFATLPGLVQAQADLGTTRMGAAQRVEIVLQFSQWPRTWHHAGPWLAGPTEGGFCREVLSHFVYLTQTLLGPLVCTHKDVAWGPEGTETRVNAQFLAGDVPVALMAGVAGGAPDNNRWTLFGEQRSLRVEDWSQVSWGDDQGWHSEQAQLGRGAGLGPFLDQLSRALDGDSHVLPDAQAGYHVMRTVESLLAREG
ncbi:MAG: Gfo/Idh/MocA family oxidoreductase [Planctomycetes bacterium]|nr:Gfo/Idh/MocA family oxidoreductase [Planctomycetota bacterium]MCB9910193.1 Gfo/Idh/MocA family oxidoreductase [Planctomycetota bacterium]MCB9911429.1 Gfo/Idh/MocA family oxidoreductase [Planctomycetota bacterium]